MEKTDLMKKWNISTGKVKEGIYLTSVYTEKNAKTEREKKAVRRHLRNELENWRKAFENLQAQKAKNEILKDFAKDFQDYAKGIYKNVSILCDTNKNTTESVEIQKFTNQIEKLLKTETK